MSLRKAKMLLEIKRGMQKEQTQVETAKEEEDKPVRKGNVFETFQVDSSSEEEQVEQKVETISEASEDKSDKEKKKKRKNKNKNKNKNEEDAELIEIDKTFKQLGIAPTKECKQERDIDRWRQILSINEGKFNYEKELRRHFKGWEKAKVETEGNKKEKRMQKMLNKQSKKSCLLPRLNDYQQVREKFELQHQGEDIKFVPTKKYSHFQVEYDAIRNMNDINAMFDFVNEHPEHVDALYSVGEFLRLQGNYPQADNLIQRVLYIYELALGYDLQIFLREDIPSRNIVYDQTSSSFFMSLFKLIDILGKKGCFNTALEYNKLLLKLNRDDPSACLLCIDYNAISAKQQDFLLEFVQYYSSYLQQSHTSIYLLPNFTYSYALAKFHLLNDADQEELLVVQKRNIQPLLIFTEQHWAKALVLPKKETFCSEDSQTLILRAIMLYPRLLIDIAKKNDYAKQNVQHSLFVGNQQKSFKQQLEHEFWEMAPNSYSYNFLKLASLQDSQGLDKVLDVYIERSKILWKSTEVMLWIKGAMGHLLNQIDKGFNYQKFLEDLCLDEGQAIPIPFTLSRYSNISRANFTDRVDRIDLNNIQDNQGQHAPPPAGNPINMQGNIFQLFINSLLPWVNLPNAQHDPNQPYIEQDDN